VQNKVLEALASGVPVVCSSVVAAALPASVRRLVRAAETSAEFSKCVIDGLQTKTEKTSTQLRESLKCYVDNLALSSQLEDLIQYPSSDSPGQQCSEQILQYIS
jgi:hypothetical protein